MAPWRVNRLRLLMVHDAHPQFADGAWDDVEAYLGTSLPSDYKRLVGAGESLSLGDELIIASPFSRTQTLLDLHTELGDIGAMRHFEDPVDSPFPVYPEAGGLLAWGSCQGAGMYWWDTTAADPDAWSVVVTGDVDSTLDTGEIVEYQRHEMPMTAYLDGLMAGEIEAAALDDWPPPGATLRPLEPTPEEVEWWHRRATPHPTDPPIRLRLHIALVGRLQPGAADAQDAFERGISGEERRTRMHGFMERFAAACQPIDDIVAVWAMDQASRGIDISHRPGNWGQPGGRSAPRQTQIEMSFAPERADEARAAVVTLLEQLEAELLRADDPLGNNWWPELQPAR